jgi:hypothetical protein
MYEYGGLVVSLAVDELAQPALLLLPPIEEDDEDDDDDVVLEAE